MRFRDFHSNVKLRIIMSFFTNTLSNMVTPFMAVYFAKTLGTTSAGTATIVSIIVGLLFAAAGGHYADRLGRKPMMVLAEGISTAAYITMALMNSPWFYSPVITMVMTIVVSAGWGLSKPSIDAMLIDVSTPETRKFMYRITYWSNNLAISIAGIIGAFFFSDYLFELFIAVAAMSLLSLIVTWIFLAETLPSAASEQSGYQRTLRAREKTSIWGSYKNVLHDKTFMTYIVASMLLVSVEMNLTNYIGIRLGSLKQDIQWMPWVEAKISGIHMLGFLRTENTLAVVVLSLFIGRLLKLRSDTKTMLIAMALNIIGYTYLTFGSQPMLLILFMLIATIGELTYVPIKQAFLVNIVPDQARSSYMAISGMVNRAALMLSGLNIIIGGFLSAGGMAVFIFLIGMTGLLILASITPSLQGALSHPKRAETASTK